MPDIVGYTYMADVHCPACTVDGVASGLFTRSNTIAAPRRDEHGLPDDLLDSDGNEVRPVFDTDGSEGNSGSWCGNCGAVIHPNPVEDDDELEDDGADAAVTAPALATDIVVLRITYDRSMDDHPSGWRWTEMTNLDPSLGESVEVVTAADVATDAHAIVRGDFVNGFKLIGPFPTKEAAIAYSARFDDPDWWAMPLTTPGG
jgi:hypothetical protein